MRLGPPIVSLCFLVGSISNAGSPKSSAANKNPQAVTVVQTALTAMGGATAIAQIQTSVVSGTSVYASTEVGAAPSFTWTTSGSEFRYEVDAVQGGHVLVSNGGNPQDFHDGAWAVVMPVIARTNLAYHVPALVLFSELNSAGYTLGYIGAISGCSLAGCT